MLVFNACEDVVVGEEVSELHPCPCLIGSRERASANVLAEPSM